MAASHQLLHWQARVANCLHWQTSLVPTRTSEVCWSHPQSLPPPHTIATPPLLLTGTVGHWHPKDRCFAIVSTRVFLRAGKSWVWRWSIDHTAHPWTMPSPRSVYHGAVICSGDEGQGATSGRAWKQTLGHLHRLLQGPRYPEFALEGGCRLQVQNVPWLHRFLPYKSQSWPPYSMGPRTGVVIASFYCSLTALCLQRLLLSLASLIAQLVKNLPVMQETLVQFLGWEDDSCHHNWPALCPLQSRYLQILKMEAIMETKCVAPYFKGGNLED